MSRRLKVILFGSGSPMSAAALTTLARVSDVVRVVVPDRPRRIPGLLRRLLRRGKANPLLAASSEAAIPISVDIADSHLTGDAPDLICVATFPHLIPADLLRRAKIGSLNLHGSVLPRHRGPDPLFWTYFDDDRETGVTLHWMTAKMDAGDIVAQRSWQLERGTRVTDIYARQTEEGCSLLGEAVASLSLGDSLRARPQDEKLATYDPSPGRRTWAIDFATWPLHRVWHFLHGLSPAHDDLLSRHGRVVRVFPDLRMVESNHNRAPGHFLISGDAFQLFCKDGIVEGRLVPRLTSIRRHFSRWLAG